MTLQLGTLVTALNELVQTALLPGSCTVTLLRVLSRTYTILSTLVKHVSVGPAPCSRLVCPVERHSQLLSHLSTSRCVPVRVVCFLLASRSWWVGVCE